MKVLIAGASGGIGSFLAENLSVQGLSVFGTFHSNLPQSKLPYKMAQVNFTNETEVSKWVQTVCMENDELSLLFCVGKNYNCMIHKSDSVLWKEVIDSNLIGVQYILRYILPIMRKSRFGRIVLFSSIVPQTGVSGTSAYSASKAAIWGLSKAVAKENAQYGITINTINLGYFDIGMIKDVPLDILKDIISFIPMKKLGNPDNILKTVNYLLSCEYMTGSQINLNGGLY